MGRADSKTVGLAVVGVGDIGSVHVSKILGSDTARLVAVSDPSSRGESIAVRCGVRNRPDYRDLLSDRPDGVIISVPNALHREVGSFFALAGVHLLVEKPLAESVEAGKAIVAAAREGGVHLLVGHHRRHSNLVSEARRLVSERLGHLLATNTLVTMRKPDDYYEQGWRRGPDAGPLPVNVIHEIDLLRKICGEISGVHATGSDLVRGFGFDDTIAIALRYASGAVGAMTVSESAPSPWSWEASVPGGLGFSTHDHDYTVFFGTEGSLTFPGLSLWHYQKGLEPGWNSPLTTTSFEVDANDPYRSQIDNFAEVIRGTATPVVSGEDALRSLAVIEAIAESIANASMVTPTW
jgi:predicted dehydrogenase